LRVSGFYCKNSYRTEKTLSVDQSKKTLARLSLKNCLP
jgi:hypothetical protein